MRPLIWRLLRGDPRYGACSRTVKALFAADDFPIPPG